MMPPNFDLRPLFWLAGIAGLVLLLAGLGIGLLL